MSDAITHLVNAVFENIRWVNRVLVVGLMTTGAFVLAKTLGSKSIEFKNISFGELDFWLVAVFLSIAHFYAAILATRSSLRLWEKGDEAACHSAYNKVTTEGGLFVRGMLARVEPAADNSKAVKMEMHDPTTWVIYLSAALLIAAITPFSATTAVNYFCLAGVAAALTIMNWRIGSLWVIGLSSLSLPNRSQAAFFRHLSSESIEFDDDELPELQVPNTSQPALVLIPVLVVLGIAAIAVLYGFGIQSDGWVAAASRIAVVIVASWILLNGSILFTFLLNERPVIILACMTLFAVVVVIAFSVGMASVL